MKVGQTVRARLSQRVPLPAGGYLSQRAEAVGTILAYDTASLTLHFTQLRLGGESEPINVRLVAAAHWLDVEDAKLPLGATDRGASSAADWTTMQIGGDEVYRSAGSGTVYDQYSQPVGRADLYGVYAPPIAPGGPERAMGPFSTTARGLYNLRELQLRSPGGNGTPIVLGIGASRWSLHVSTALLLQISGQ